MQPSVNERVGSVGVAGALRGRAKPDLTGKARIAVRHTDGCAFVMGVNVREPVLLAQLHNDVLVGIAHDCKNVIDALGRNCRRERFQYLHNDLRLIDVTARHDGILNFSHARVLKEKGNFLKETVPRR
jgi:hypothetical protein